MQIYGGRDVENKLKRLLDRESKKIIAALLAAWRRDGKLITETDAEQAIKTGKLKEDFEKTITAVFTGIVTKQLATAAISGGDVAKAISKALKVKYGYTSAQIKAAEFLEKNAARMIKEITASQRAAIRQILIHYGSRDLRSVPEIARMIRASVGLSERYAKAAIKQADGVFDQLTKEGATERVASKKSVKALERKAGQLTTLRANIIARSELAKAWAYAHHETVKDARNKGLFGRKQLYKRWLSALDERVCSICEGMDGTEEPLDDYYPVEGGSYMIEGREGETTYEFAHLSCRCTGIIIVR